MAPEADAGTARRGWRALWRVRNEPLVLAIFSGLLLNVLAMTLNQAVADRFARRTQLRAEERLSLRDMREEVVRRTGPYLYAYSTLLRVYELEGTPSERTRAINRFNEQDEQWWASHTSVAAALDMTGNVPVAAAPWDSLIVSLDSLDSVMDSLVLYSTSSQMPARRRLLQAGQRHFATARGAYDSLLRELWALQR